MKPLRNITRADVVIRLVVIALALVAWFWYT